jgi:hypothetical protein
LFGILERIGGYEELSIVGGQALGGEIAVTERVVGALQGTLKSGEVEPEAFAERVREFLELYDERSPRWLTPAFVLAVRERLHLLEGRWRATPFGQTMELEFPAAR